MSIQDQLLKAGLVDKNTHRQQKTVKRKQKKQPQTEDEARIAKDNAQKSMVAKAQRDRELNRQRQQSLEDKAAIAQIRQLIDTNAVTIEHADTAYSFTHGKLIKKINVDKAISEAIGSGRLAIVDREAKIATGNASNESSPQYHLVPRAVAEKIRARHAEFVVVLYDKVIGEDDATDNDDTDPYAKYQIPDDLMW